MRPEVLFIGEETLKERTVVSENVDSKYLMQVIWTVQEMKIHPELGTMLYKRLVKGIQDNSLKAEEKELLNDYVANAMVFFCMAELPMVLGYKFYNKNVVRQTPDFTESASMSDMAVLMNTYQSKAEFFVMRMKRFIEAERGKGRFPEYGEGEKSDEIPPKRKGYSCPFVL